LSVGSAADGESAENLELLFESAPCGYLVSDLDGTIRKVNRTFVRLTGLTREELIGGKRFQDLLTTPGRIYHETHYFPLLRMHGSVKEIALEIVRGDGSRLPVLVNAAIDEDKSGSELVQTMVFDATERRRYEEGLLRDRRDEHEIAQKLQQSLLAGALPDGPKVEVVGHYQPAVRGLAVGGDWYDAFWLDRDRVGLVAGDVVGRGIEAAAAMGQLRSATRAFASTGLRPGALMEALDDFAKRYRVGAFATVAYAEVGLTTMELRLACAGHLPPVLIESGSQPLLLWEGRSPPLTMQKPSEAREEAVKALSAQSRLILYTDGLVERREETIDEGLDRLLTELRDDRRRSLSDLTRDLVRALEVHENADDICVLTASLG
jgi:phosphoserine phosphatase RsbU/P